MTNILSVFKTGREGLIRNILFLLLIAILVQNTGLVSDDFDILEQTRSKTITQLLFPQGRFQFIETPIEYYLMGVWYRFFSTGRSWPLDMLKIIYIFLCLIMIAKFFSLFLPPGYATWVSFLFIFYPSHDATVYWFMGQYLTLMFGFYCFAFYSAFQRKITRAVVFAFLGSFISYGSLALAIPFGVFFFLRKRWKEGAALLVPNIVYIIYYFILSKVAMIGVDKVGTQSFLTIIKQFILQVITGIDALLGPSLWFKVYYALSNMTVISVVLAVIVSWFFFRALICSNAIPRPDTGLIGISGAVLFLSWCMFSMTGLYPQLAFNLGDRVTIFGSFLVSYLALTAPMPRLLRLFMVAIICMSVFGISDHWRAWNDRQTAVMENIRGNEDIERYKNGETVYVSGNQYSKLGPFSHIEFLSEGFVAGHVFTMALGRYIPVDPINKLYAYENSMLIDRKYGRSFPIGSSIVVYDSEKDRLMVIEAGKINDYIQNLPVEYRHWVQLLGDGPFRALAVKLMPRLSMY